jgi:hypothetical protein
VRDKTFVKAIYAKAESLYNTCDFEHALIFYHRGQVSKKSTEGRFARFFSKQHTKTGKKYTK